MVKEQFAGKNRDRIYIGVIGVEMRTEAGETSGGKTGEGETHLGKFQRASGLHSTELCATEVVEVLPKLLNGRWDILQKRNLDFSVANGME